jgi:hypothetical protein
MPSDPKVRMIKRAKAIVIHPEGKPIFDAMATVIEIDDQAAGEYVEVKQGDRSISINPEEWPMIMDSIHEMVRACIPMRGKP